MQSPSEIRSAKQALRGAPKAPDAAAPYSVSRLNRETKMLLEAGIPPLWLEAEISNLARPASGHLYFTLKDSKAQVRCAMFRASAGRAGTQPENGQQVLVHGRLGLYEPRGDYQLIVDKMEAAGEGLLRRAYEQLKEKLEAEGLFEQSHKRELPAFPRKIGVVTSPTGAAVKDILIVLKRRFAAIDVVIYPTPVQGDEAPSKIVSAIQAANQHGAVDILICGRGGGSLEDLWAFNNEAVARAIHASEIPVISAVGHEVDYSIADFVADLRAPTPSAAAELASPESADWLSYLASTERSLKRNIGSRIDNLSQRSDWLERRLTSRSPRQQLSLLQQRIEHARYKLSQSTKAKLSQQHQAFSQLSERLTSTAPSKQISQLNARLQPISARLAVATNRRLETNSRRWAIAAAKLHTVSPLATLERGYSITQSADGTVVTKQSQVKPGERILLRLSDGAIHADVVDNNE